MMEIAIGRDAVDHDLEIFINRPAPTRLSAWLGNAKPKVKKIERSTYKDPYEKKRMCRQQPVIRKKRSIKAKAPKKTEKKPVEISFPDGKTKRYDSIVEAAEKIGFSDSALNGWLRGVRSKAGYKARYV